MGKICGTRSWRAAFAAALAAGALAVSPAHAKTATGHAKVAIVPPLSLVNTSDLAFGSIVPSAAAGTVTISETTGGRTAAGGVTLLGGTFGRGTFTGNPGTQGLVFFQLNTGTVTLNKAGGGGSMSASLVLESIAGTSILFNSNTTKLVLMNDNQVFSIHVGGTLTVAANQPKGSYDGTFTLTANYF